MARLAVSLIGPIRVTLDAQPVASFGYDKVRALVAYLAVESSRPHERDTLAALLWPGDPPGVARKYLRTALATLRQAIGDATAMPPFLLITRDALQFNPAGDYELDVASFSALLTDVEHHAHAHGSLCDVCKAKLAQAAELYRGEFLHQVSVPGSMSWEEWALLLRERLRGQMLDALAQLSAYHESRQQDDLARRYAWRALALEPWDEAAHRSLMRIFARNGQRADALAQFERCRRVLAAELGVEPAAETTALYERLRAEPGVIEPGPCGPRTTPTLPPRAARGNLPSPPNGLIGRSQELLRLCHRLRQDVVRLVTLTGPPGIGKTRLGLQVALEMSEAFEGAYFVPLAPVQDSSLVPVAIMAALGLHETTGHSPEALLKAHLREQALLLVLDSFEHVAGAALLVADLLTACPRLKILVTSRAPLKVRAEHQVPVAPLAVPDLARPLDRADVALTPAVALFVERAQAIRPDFTLSAQNTEAVAAICRRLDGLPLAIELAAARTKLLSPQKLLQWLANPLTLLNTPMSDVSPHHRTLRAAITWSYDLLNPEEQFFFRRLGVFVGGWSLEAAAALCAHVDIAMGERLASADGAPLSPHHATNAEVLDRLGTLAEHSLVQQRTDADGEPHFTLLETLREYGLEQLHAHQETAAIQCQHAGYYMTLAEAAATELTGPEQAAWLNRLEREHDNIRAALQWANTQGDLETMARLCAALWRFWQIRGHVREGWGWCEMVLAQRGALPLHLRARVLYGASWISRQGRDLHVATALLEEALALYRALEDERGVASVLSALGTAHMYQGDAAQAVLLLEQGLALSRATGDQRQIAVTLSHLGWLARMRGDYERATPLLEEALTLSRACGDERCTGDCLANLGMIALAHDDVGWARALIEQSLSIYRALGDKRLVATVLNHAGAIAQAQGAYAEARAQHEQSVAVFREIGDTASVAKALRSLGEVAMAQGNLGEARTLLEESRALSQLWGDKLMLSTCLNSLGQVAFRQGLVKESVVLHCQSLTLFYEMGNIVAVAQMLSELAAVANTQRQPLRAARLWGAAEAQCEATGASLPRRERDDYELRVADARAQVAASDFEAAWQEGRALTREEIIASALAVGTLAALDIADMERSA